MKEFVNVAVRSFSQQYGENERSPTIENSKMFLYYALSYAPMMQFIDTLYFTKLELICILLDILIMI